jgi:FkbM family methyltransferase
MTIYDFGANKGQNLKYYLSKNYKVVAIEANPDLCNLINNKFINEIKLNKLIVLNNCLSETNDGALVDFYVHKKRNVLSQFTKPSDDILSEFVKIEVPSRKPSSIIKQFGEPYFIKIDLEHYDLNVLNELILNNVKAKYFSIEAHDKIILDTLIDSNLFKYFNLVKGDNFRLLYNNFNAHSAGPFGPDLISPWLDKNKIRDLVNELGYGWIDIHATSEDYITLNEINVDLYKNNEGLKNRIHRYINTILFKFFSKAN